MFNHCFEVIVHNFEIKSILIIERITSSSFIQRFDAKFFYFPLFYETLFRYYRKLKTILTHKYVKRLDHLVIFVRSFLFEGRTRAYTPIPMVKLNAGRTNQTTRNVARLFSHVTDRAVEAACRLPSWKYNLPLPVGRENLGAI